MGQRRVVKVDVIGLRSGDGQLGIGLRAVGRHAAAADLRGVVSGLVLGGVAQARCQVQRVADIPGQLSEAGIAADGRDRAGLADIALQQISGHCRADQPEGGIRTPLGDVLAVQHLVIAIQACGVLQCPVARGGNAQLLGILLLLHRVGRLPQDVQACVVAVVGRLPVPVAPGTDRGQRVGTQVPVSAQRSTAYFRAGFDGRIHIGQTVIGVSAGRCVVQDGGHAGVLAVGCAQRGAIAHIDLRAAVGVLQRIVGRGFEFQRVVDVPQQLATGAEVVLVVDVMRGGGVVGVAVAQRLAEGDAASH